MAGLCGKVETELEIKSSHEEFFKVFKSQSHQVPKISPGNVNHVEVHEGDWESEGSVKHWKYNLEGEQLGLKERVEKIDEENKTITFDVVDGDVKKHYKNFKATLHAFGKNGKHFVKWSFDFEKTKEDVATPHRYVEFAHKVTTDIDTHLYKA